MAALWASFTTQKKLVIIGVTIAMFAAIFAMSQLAGKQNMALLYAGLDGNAAGEVITALDQRRIPYEVRGDSIFVDSAQRDSVRMSLAGEGIPNAGSKGYELLDNMSGFSTTSQMFDAAYWRAKEGELARTILATPGVKTARVHIAYAPIQAFRGKQSPTASVTITTYGTAITAAQAKAFKHLIAAAVSGMRPEDVSVIDSLNGLVNTGDGENNVSVLNAAREDTLRHNVERLLAARVGAGKAVVEVSLDVINDHEQITERMVDPQSRVAISSDTEEKSGNATESPQNVSVASNLPAGDANNNGGQSQSQNAQTRERVNFEVSETKRELIKTPGTIRKLSVAVLVDHARKVDAQGNVTFEPRSEEELATLRELVASAVGYDEKRGDVLTVKSLPFDVPAEQGTMAVTGFMPNLQTLNLMTLIQIGVAAFVSLILGLFVVRPIFTASRRDLVLEAMPAPLALPPMAADQQAAGPNILPGTIDQSGALLPAEAANEPKTIPSTEHIARLRNLIDKRQTESVAILRGWLEPEEGR